MRLYRHQVTGIKIEEKQVLEIGEYTSIAVAYCLRYHFYTPEFDHTSQTSLLEEKKWF